jgi:hypothetical protein
MRANKDEPQLSDSSELDDELEDNGQNGLKQQTLKFK